MYRAGVGTGLVKLIGLVFTLNPSHDMVITNIVWHVLQYRVVGRKYYIVQWCEAMQGGGAQTWGVFVKK